MKYKIIIFVILSILFVLFILQNIAIIEIQFLFWSLKISQSLLIFLLLLIGTVMGWFLRGYYTYRKINR